MTRITSIGLLSIALLGAGAMESAETRSSTRENLRPVIGVFSQDTDTVTNSSTIDLIGVLPILLRQPKEYYEEIFAQTNLPER
jgi:hypothetical protein